MTTPAIFPERPRVALPVAAVLGESPVWDHRSGALLFVDVKSGIVFRWRPADGQEPERFPVGGQVGFVVPTEDPAIVLAGRQDGVVRLDLRDGSVRHLSDPEPDRPGNRLNDACAGPDGALLFGTMDDGEEVASGGFYHLAGTALRRFGLEAAVTNGPTLDAEAGLFYTTQTESRRVWRHRIGPDGHPGEAEPFVTFREGDGHPDGCAVDAEGCLWVAHFGGARITRFSPDGEPLLVVTVPTPKPTKPAFGGPDLSTLYVTTDSRGADRETDPMAGHLLAVDVGIRGRETHFAACPA